MRRLQHHSPYRSTRCEPSPQSRKQLLELKAVPPPEEGPAKVEKSVSQLIGALDQRPPGALVDHAGRRQSSLLLKGLYRRLGLIAETAVDADALRQQSKRGKTHLNVFNGRA